MLRVAIVGEAHGVADEGTHVYFDALAAAYDALGVGLERFSIASTSGRSRLLSPSLMHAIRRGRFDAVQYIPKSGLTSASLARTAYLGALAGPSRVFGTYLQSDTALPRLRFPARTRALVLATSLRDAMKEKGFDAHVCGVGVDPERYHRDGAHDDSLWPEGSGPRFLHVGHLKPGRRLEVFAELARRGGRCLVIGSTSTEPDPHVVDFLEQAGVRVVRRFISDLGAVYRAADVYVFSVTDVRSAIAVPLSVLEAVACGTPVVSTDFGALREHVPADQSVVFVDPARIADAAFEPPARVPTGGLLSWREVASQNLELFEKQAFRPPSGLVALVGVDGSGKSTQAKLLADEASLRGIRTAVVWARWDPLILKPLTRLVGRAAVVKSGDGFARGLSWKRRVFRSPVARHAWRLASAIDYAVRTVPLVVRARRSVQLVIVDRYFPDALVDLAVNFDVPTVGDGVFRLFPRAAIVLVLDVSEEIALARKDDIPSREYLAQRRPRYLRLAEQHGWPVIDASQPTDEVRRAIAEAVFGQ